jgi:type VI secretion system protein ImpG
VNTRLLDYYNRELRYLRELSGEFARDFPKVAGRLGLDAFECGDPYVERLLEGSAFLAARVQMNLDAEFPRFTEQLLERLCPNYLVPTPSMAVVQFLPDPRQDALNSGFVIPRNSALTGKVGRGDGTTCQYRTAHDVTLWPIEITSLVHTHDAGDLGRPSFRPRRPVKGALRLGLRSTNGLPFSEFQFDRLAFFIRGNDAVSLRLFELIVAGSLGVLLRQPGAASFSSSGAGFVRTLGMDPAESLLPAGAAAFQGYRLLHEYFAFPSRLLFVEFSDIGPGVLRCEGEELEIVVALDRHDASVESAVTPLHMGLFCAPAVNLFPKTADRIQMTANDCEYQVVADRTRPLDYEVHSLREVACLGGPDRERREFTPRWLPDATQERGFFTVERRARPGVSQPSRSGYSADEVFVTLVDRREVPFRAAAGQLAVETLCTNGDLPLRMEIGKGRTDFVVGAGAPVASVRCVAGPSPPRPAQAYGDMSWRLIDQLSLNHLVLTDSPDAKGADALRQLLRLYAHLCEPRTRRQIEGVRSVAVGPGVRRLPAEGVRTFARGVEVSLECDEGAFDGTSAFLLASVLERFFARYVSQHSFTETVLRSVERGEIVRWPPRLGLRRST